jgi:transcriptional regulator with XRE-family HTH domain
MPTAKKLPVSAATTQAARAALMASGPAAWVCTGRKKLGLTQAQLSAASGVSLKTIQRIEQGQDTQYSSLVALGRALQVTLLPVPSALTGQVQDILASGGRVASQAQRNLAPSSRLDSASSVLASVLARLEKQHGRD